MKKLLILLPLALLFVMCKSKTTAKATPKDYIIYNDNFKGASDAQKSKFLKGIDATGENYSVLMLTKNFIGAEITVTTGGKQVYKGYPISDKKGGVTETIRISNTADTEVYDSYTKQKMVLEQKDNKKYKFIYMARSGAKQVPFKVMYSNKLMK